MKKNYSFLILGFLPFIYSLKYQSKSTQLYIVGCKIGCYFYNLLIFNIYCGAYGTRTRDPMRDRHVF